MENLKIEASKYTPLITMDIQKGEIEIRGKSYPENTFEFYKPVLEWIENYHNTSNPSLTLNLEIIYFNSSSSKLFYDLFDLLEENSDAFKPVINWIYDEENESALESGEEFMEDFEDLNINLVEKSGQTAS